MYLNTSWGVTHMSIFTGIMFMLGFLVGFAFGWIMKNFIVQYQTAKLVKRMNDAATKAVEIIEKNTIFVEVEKHSEDYFFYDNVNHMFLCRGSTAEELASAFKDRFPEKNAVIVAGEEKIVRYLEQQFSEYFNSLEKIENT